MMKLFICYRRHDSIHAAQRLRMYLQMQFGQDAVFIDQAIPPGVDWQQHLDHTLEACSDVIVLVGDEFIRRLAKSGKTGTAPDEADDVLVQEIATAIRLKRTIYPFLFGGVDMPTTAQLPEPIQDFAKRQAIFAREPAFDTAMNVLGETLRTEHGLLPARAERKEEESSGPAAILRVALQAFGLAVIGIVTAWFVGALVTMLADLPEPPTRRMHLEVWQGARYLLLTMLLGLGPYAAYWLLAVLRARARLPIRNLSGLLAAFNVGSALVVGGTFLLLSTLPNWRLRPVFPFPDTPSVGDYTLLAFGLLAMVIATIAVALWEPKVRTLHPAQRRVGIGVLNAAALTVALTQVLFALSIVNSLPLGQTIDPVALLGYAVLCPTISLLYAYGWKYGQAQFDARERGWEFVFLFVMVASLMVYCTLGLYAYGVAPMFAVF
jgi:TIR domain